MGYRRDSEGFRGILVQVLIMPLTSHSKERRGVTAIDMLLWFLMWPGPLGFPFSHQRSSIKCHNSTPCTLAIASCYPPLISLFSCFPDSTLCLQRGIQQKKAWKVARGSSSVESSQADPLMGEWCFCQRSSWIVCYLIEFSDESKKLCQTLRLSWSARFRLNCRSVGWKCVRGGRFIVGQHSVKQTVTSLSALAAENADIHINQEERKMALHGEEMTEIKNINTESWFPRIINNSCGHNFVDDCVCRKDVTRGREVILLPETFSFHPIPCILMCFLETKGKVSQAGGKFRTFFLIFSVLFANIA